MMSPGPTPAESLASSIPLRWSPAQPKQQAALRDLILAMAQESEGRLLESTVLEEGIQAIFDHPHRGTYWVLGGQVGQPVGCTLITPEWSDWNNATYWWIQSLYIVPAYRGQRYFEALLSELEQAAMGQNVRELRLYVERDNIRAQRVYARNGFNGEHYRCMTKPLGAL